METLAVSSISNKAGFLPNRVHYAVIFDTRLWTLHPRDKTHLGTLINASDLRVIFKLYYFIMDSQVWVGWDYKRNCKGTYLDIVMVKP